MRAMCERRQRTARRCVQHELELVVRRQRPLPVCAQLACGAQAGCMLCSTWSIANLGREQALAAVAAADGGDLAVEERDEQQVGARVPPPAEPAAQCRMAPRLQDVCRPRQRSMRLRRWWRQGGVEERLGVWVHRRLGAAGQARPGAPLVTSQLLVRPAGQERPERVHAANLTNLRRNVRETRMGLSETVQFAIDTLRIRLESGAAS